MRIIFAGTPIFSIPTLNALLTAGHEITLVLTQPDRPAGRGQKIQFSPVKTTALHHGLNVLQPPSLKSSEIQILLKNQRADVMIVVAYGLILPQAILDLPQFGCINVHASLLPRWRGAAPIVHALLAGDESTGVTIMKMDKGLDTGDMLKKGEFTISPSDTAQTLHDRLSQLGATLLIEILHELEKTKTLIGEKQNDTDATYANKINKTDALLNWHLSAHTLEKQVRAYNPWPIAYFLFKEENLRVWEATALTLPHTALPGTLLEANSKHLYIACKEGVFSPRILQFPGKKPQTWETIYSSRKTLFTPGILLCP